MDLSLSLLCVDLEVYNPPNEKYNSTNNGSSKVEGYCRQKYQIACAILALHWIGLCEMEY